MKAAGCVHMGVILLIGMLQGLCSFHLDLFTALQKAAVQFQHGGLSGGALRMDGMTSHLVLIIKSSVKVLWSECMVQPFSQGPAPHVDHRRPNLKVAGQLAYNVHMTRTVITEETFDVAVQFGTSQDDLTQDDLLAWLLGCSLPYTGKEHQGQLHLRHVVMLGQPHSQEQLAC
ncbi:hypothetical protein JOB18_033793 [Solea senegalensis]|uniref:Uncharacterized protein n=1 Tax=Solea senegalensis TaxID=28829 RepID=A0AAV6QX59_SOLSE|nr:hypothetical protein JOB18_033793 [Solea senegalensis]